MNFEAMSETVKQLTEYGIKRDPNLNFRSARLSNELSESLIRSGFFDCDIAPNQEASCLVVNTVRFYTFNSVRYKNTHYSQAIFAIKEDLMGYTRVCAIIPIK